jgi:uncharacterized protein YjbI with pentapeptide repeats
MNAPVKKIDQRKLNQLDKQLDSASYTFIPLDSFRVAHPSPDIQAILTVVGRRDFKDETERLDLINTQLPGADLSGAHLEGASVSAEQLLVLLCQSWSFGEQYW